MHGQSKWRIIQMGIIHFKVFQHLTWIFEIGLEGVLKTMHLRMLAMSSFKIMKMHASPLDLNRTNL